LNHLGVALDIGWRVEINLDAVAWIRDAIRRLTRGFIILIDYGHEAHDLYSASHSTGTLTTFSRHVPAGPEQGETFFPWLLHPGGHDITAHVDFTSVRAAAEAEGAATIALLDQTYFVLGLMEAWRAATKRPADHPAWRALKTLALPGGLGSTHKVLILGKDVGSPALSCCSFSTRLT
jgi:SAM-dependent MidA family methyltransferase